MPICLAVVSSYTEEVKEGELREGEMGLTISVSSALMAGITFCRGLNVVDNGLASCFGGSEVCESSKVLD